MERVGPARFCVYRDVNQANNLLEAKYWVLNADMGTHHPKPWTSLVSFNNLKLLIRSLV